MIEVEVKVFAPFIQYTEKPLLRISLVHGARVQDLVVQLLEEYPKLRDGLMIKDDMECFMHEVLLLKGETIVQWQTTLQDGDQVLMLPAIVSG
jgi:molybdopterin converting factor small subunit